MPAVIKKDELMHYGVLGMHWGIRRYQPYGKGGYNPKNEPSQRIMSKMSKISDKISKDAHKISKKEFDDEVKRNPKKYEDDFKKESLYKSIFNKKRWFDGNFDKGLRNEYEAEKKKLLDIDEQEVIQNKKQYEKLRKQSLNICGRDFDLDVDLDLYSGDPITKWHIEKMKQVKKLDFNSLKSPLKEYIKNDYIHADLDGKEISDNPFKYIKPKSIFINESPIQERAGILMDCNYKFDPEHGLCFLFGEDGKVLRVAPIDYFI